MWRYPMMRGGYGFGWGWGVAGALGLVIFWIILIVVLVKIFKHSGIREKEDNALNVLRERFAKGEIDKKTFEEMKKTLG